MEEMDDLDEYKPLCLWCLENPPTGDLRISVDALDYVRIQVCTTCFNRLMHRLPHTGEYQGSSIIPHPTEQDAWLRDHPNRRIIYQAGSNGSIVTIVEDKPKPEG